MSNDNEGFVHSGTTTGRMSASSPPVSSPGNIEFTDRYDALGIPHPDPATVCKGHCEGTGWVPIHRSDLPGYVPTRHDEIVLVDKVSEEFADLWRRAEAENPADDGWHFVKCPDCGGTGRRM